jgi:hypothetical protein
MTKSNMWDGFCKVCRARVRPGEGVVEADAGARQGWVVLCPEHSSSVLDPPAPPEVSRLPSIHLGEEKYER